MKYTKEIIEETVSNCKSWADVCRKLNIKPNTGSQSHLQKRAKKLGIDTPDYFLGKAWNKQKKGYNKTDINQYLTNKVKITSHNLRIRLVKEGYKKEECEICGLTQWCGEKIGLELDHIDSNHFNNELSNLQILCPNCHAQQTKKRKI